MGRELNLAVRGRQLVEKLRFFASSPIHSFIILAGVFGMLIIALTPPLTGGDEEAHFIRAYGISEGNFIIRSNEEVSMPKSYRQTLGCLQDKKPVAGDTYTYSYDRYAESKKVGLQCALTLKQGSGDREYISTTASGYSPLTYIPQVSAIIIGRLLNFPIVLTVYLVRIFTLIAYIGLIAGAIWLMPRRKWALVGMALLPVPLMQVTNPGGDYMLMGASAILVATVLYSRSLKEARLSRQGAGLVYAVAISGVLLVTTKGFFPGICFLPLILFFAGLKKWIGKKMLILGGIIAVAFLWQMIGAPIIEDSSTHAATTGTVFTLPHAFLKTMFFKAGFHSWVDSDFIYNGPGLGLNSPVGMPAIVITLMNMLVGIYVFAEYSKSRTRDVFSKLENRALLFTGISVCVAIVLGIFAALYLLAWNIQKGDDIINGVATRYFYPGFLLLAVLPFNRYIKTTQRFYVYATLIGSIIILSTQCIAIALRYKWGML